MSANKWPQARAARIAFIEQRIEEWTSKAGQIGLSTDEAGQLADMVQTARQRLDAALLARSLAKSATGEFHAAADPFSAYAGILIRKIRAFAEATADPAVYTIAQIDPVAPPTPAPPPETPADMTTSLRNDGAAELRWKSRSPRGMGGVTYEVQRRLATEQTYTILGSTTDKAYIDETLPPATPWASYRVLARRAGQASDVSEPVIVYLGVPPGEADTQIGLAA